MLKTILRFEGNDGTAFMDAVDSADIKDFQKMQNHIVKALLKMGDDAAEGKLPPATDARVKPQFASTISMETIGSGDKEGFYSRVTAEYRFDHRQNYAAEIEFCKSLLNDVIDKFGKKK